MDKILSWIKKHIYVVGVIIILGIPVTVYLLSVLPLLPSGVNNDWAGFWGGYLGALIGAMVTWWGITVTLEETREQFKEDKKIEHMPYIRVESVNDKSIRGTKTFYINDSIGTGLLSVNNNIQIRIQNIGLGPAIDFNMSPIICKYSNENKVVDYVYDAPTFFSLNINEDVIVIIKEQFNITLNEFEEILEDSYTAIEEETERIYKDFKGNFLFSIYYKDLLKFTYKLDINLPFYARFYKDGGKHLGFEPIELSE